MRYFIQFTYTLNSHTHLAKDMGEIEDPLKNSHKKLNIILGVLGTSLPFILYLGNWIRFDDDRLRSSLSMYYHTGMRDIFVGYLFAMGFVLIAYEGHKRTDFIAGVLAGVFALGVALFPTTPETASETDLFGWIHIVSSILFYLLLVYFCFGLFTRSDQSSIAGKKRQRNIVYYVSGTIMLLSVLAIVGNSLIDLNLGINNLVFWLEFLANLAFGFAWLVKGEGIWFLNDDPIEEWSNWEKMGLVGLFVLFAGTTTMVVHILAI